MTQLRPRLGRTDGRVLCGFAPRGSALRRCSGQLGRLVMSALLRDALVAIPVAGDHHPTARAAAEAQAPPAAAVAVFFVLPEGFILRDGEWRMTAHRRQRDRAIARLAVHRRATRSGRRQRGIAMARSCEPALPALVRCPECGRPNEVSAAGIEAMFVEIAADFNRRAAVLPHDAAGFLRYAGEGLGFPLVGGHAAGTAPASRQPQPADADRPDPLPQQSGTDQWGDAQVILERLRILCPTLPLVMALAAGEPVAADDFFVVRLPEAFPVALADRAHYTVMVERVAHDDLIRGLTRPLP